MVYVTNYTTVLHNNYVLFAYIKNHVAALGHVYLPYVYVS